MKLIRRVLNSKTLERFRRTLVVNTGIYCRIKKLNPTVSEDLRLVKLLHHFSVTKVLDVGANTGQFAESLVDFGYNNQIVSFEPAEDPYKALIRRSGRYKQWTVADRCAIGNMEGTIDINVSESTDFSSIKAIKQDFVEKESVAKTVKKETVPIHTLDQLKGTYFDDTDRIFLKIDTQGYEQEVIEGASELMKNVVGIKLEINLSKRNALYENIQWDINDYLGLFRRYGMECVSLEGISADKITGEMYEADGIFFRYDR